jgi:ribosomal-protein-alanine N-acetyltransferase
MTEAVKTLLPFAFGTLRLNRVEAACMPSNAASIRVLESTGFVREGMARGYLKINGQWEDHLLFGTLACDHATRQPARWR